MLQHWYSDWSSRRENREERKNPAWANLLPRWVSHQRGKNQDFYWKIQDAGLGFLRQTHIWVKDFSTTSLMFIVLMHELTQARSTINFLDGYVLSLQEVKVFRTPSPPPRPSPIEIALPDTFTVDQMKLLYRQFVCSAPSGFISNKGFVDTLSDMTALTVSLIEG